MSAAATPSRRAAYETVRRTFEHDAWTDRAFPAAAARHGLAGRDRAQAQHLAYGAVQRRATTDHMIAELSGRRPESLDPPVIAALRLGAFELVFGHGGGAGDHAIVDGWVEIAKQGMTRGGRGGPRARGAAGLVNAVLRRLAAERARLVAELGDGTPAAAAIADSVPLWLAEMWWAELGPESARSLLAAINEPLPTALRLADPGGDAAALAQRLGSGASAGRGTGPLDPADSIVVEGALGEQALALLGSGELVAQSLAAQAVIALLGVEPGERVLDLCAGPGVKASAIAARLGPDGRLTAVEVDAGRARQVSELCERTGSAAVDVVVGDGAEAALEAGYDRVLVDPPCSDLGTLASRPDARWRKSPEAIGELAALQRALLGRALTHVRPGGTVVYSTCTVSRSENEEVVVFAEEQARAGDLVVDDLGAVAPALALPADRRFLQTRPDRDQTDGFFIARLRRPG